VSIIFGIRRAEGQIVDERKLTGLAHGTERYAFDGTFVRADGQTGMGFQPYHTHQRSNLESQPVVDDQGNMLTFDGRLDNHSELRGLLAIHEANIADSMIVLAAFEHWGEDCFSKFIGDWALALWSHSDRSLYLARDHAGTRTLYFEQAGDRILWSTYLETFFVEGRTHVLDDGFAACYLACQPVGNLTPYKGIRSVPPAHYLKFHKDDIVHEKHWQWTTKNKIRYRTDAEYEEHFLVLLSAAVARRTGPGAPIVAQLSGGMDSTSIVCVSDRIRMQQGAAADELLDTVSYYDDSEPGWDEKPYFSAVERIRRKFGVHFDASIRTGSFQLPDSEFGPYLTPGMDLCRLEKERKLTEIIESHGYRAIVSGIGGDELLGGNPDPLPELADLLVSGHPVHLFRQALVWSVQTRKPIVSMFRDTIAFLMNLHGRDYGRNKSIPEWLTPRISELASVDESQGDRRRLSWMVSPSRLVNWLGLCDAAENFPNRSPDAMTRLEYRFPYMDRDLVEFILSIPREQLVRPGARRSLMRRSLRGIVPDCILNRRRKAVLIKGPLSILRESQSVITALMRDALSVDRAIIDYPRFRSALISAVEGRSPEGWAYLVRTLKYELWLRSNYGTEAVDADRNKPLSVGI